MDENEAQALFDKLGAGVPDERPHLSEFVIAADQERTKEGPRRHRALVGAIAAGVVLVGGGVFGATLLGHRDTAPPPATRPGTAATADQLTGQWTDGNTTIRLLPDVGDLAGRAVEYVDATSSGTIALDPDGLVTVAGDTDPADPLGRTTSIEATGTGLRLLDARGHQVAALTTPPIPPTVPPSGQVTTIHQITGTWDAADLVGQPQPDGADQLIVTTSWLAVHGDCTAYQSDYELGANGAITTHDFAESDAGGCAQTAGLAAAVMGQAATVTLNAGVLGIYDAGDIEIAEFRRAARPTHVDNPVGTWTPVGATDSQLQLTPAQGAVSGRVTAHQGDCAVSGIWYLTSDGTFVSSVGPTATSAPGCDETSPDLHAFENISRAQLDRGQLSLIAPDGSELLRYDRTQ